MIRRLITKFTKILYHEYLELYGIFLVAGKSEPTHLNIARMVVDPRVWNGNSFCGEFGPVAQEKC